MQHVKVLMKNNKNLESLETVRELYEKVIEKLEIKRINKIKELKVLKTTKNQLKELEKEKINVTIAIIPKDYHKILALITFFKTSLSINKT